MYVECNKNNRDGSKLVEWHSTWVSLQIKPYREKSHATLNKAFYNNMNSHSKKVLDRDKTSLMLSQTFISIECCSSVITQFHINIKISVMDYLFQTQDIWVQLLMCNNTKVTCVYFNLFVEMNVTFSISKKEAYHFWHTLLHVCVTTDASNEKSNANVTHLSPRL